MNTLSMAAAPARRPRIFALNALYLALLGADLLLFAGWMVEVMVDDPLLRATMGLDAFIRGIGLFCLGCAAATLFAGRTWLTAVPMFNLATAALTALVALLAFNALTGTGIAILLVLAVIDAEFAWFQYRAMRAS